MPINSRNKGAAGEREVARIIDDLLGVKVERNLDQWRAGGYDLVGLAGWAIEVKRAKKPLLNAWWAQTLEQARINELKPVLWYRLDNQKWRVVVPMNLISRGITETTDLDYCAELSPEGFATLYRERHLIK